MQWEYWRKLKPSEAPLVLYSLTIAVWEIDQETPLHPHGRKWCGKVEGKSPIETGETDLLKETWDNTVEGTGLV